MLLAFAFVFGAIVYRLVEVQAIGSTGAQLASSEPVQAVRPPALRGSILASNGDELAFTEMRYQVIADPFQVQQLLTRAGAVAEAATLAPMLGVSAASISAAFARHSGYAVLAPAISQSAELRLATRIAKGSLVGITTSEIPVRYDPDGTLAAPLIGVVNAEGQGEGGLEQADNRILTGKPGTIVESFQAGTTDPIPGTATEDIPAVAGRDILTTIDEALQYQTETALASAITAAKAKGGTAIVMDRRTGALLAVASLVASKHGPVAAPSLQAFTYAYEPGSVEKVVTVAAGLAQGVVTPTTKLSDPDLLVIGNRKFRDDLYYHSTFQLTPTAVLAQSSNIGAIRIATRVGADQLYGYIRSFGLTQKTAVNFPGETQGIIPTPAEFTGSTLPTLAYGQGIAVTAAQMTAAINTIANGGLYVPPRLVTATVGADGREEPVPVAGTHQVVPGQVAQEVTAMLEQVVSAGTGAAAAVPHYAVAGKTGTAEAYVVNQKTGKGGYSTTRFVSSFAGFAPAQDPAITTMVVIDDTPSYGATAAAPAWSTIMRDALLDLDIPSTGTQPAAVPAAFPTINGVLQPAEP